MLWTQAKTSNVVMPRIRQATDGVLIGLIAPIAPATAEILSCQPSLDNDEFL